MKEVINNNNKYKLKYWFAMLYIHGKFMTGPVFTYQSLSEDFIFYQFIKIWAPIFARPKVVTNLKNALYYSLILYNYRKKIIIK